MERIQFDQAVIWSAGEVIHDADEGEGGARRHHGQRCHGYRYHRGGWVAGVRWNSSAKLWISFGPFGFLHVFTSFLYPCFDMLLPPFARSFDRNFGGTVDSMWPMAPFDCHIKMMNGKHSRHIRGSNTPQVIGIGMETVKEESQNQNCCRRCPMPRCSSPSLVVMSMTRMK